MVSQAPAGSSLPPAAKGTIRAGWMTAQASLMCAQTRYWVTGLQRRSSTETDSTHVNRRATKKKRRGDRLELSRSTPEIIRDISMHNQTNLYLNSMSEWMCCSWCVMILVRFFFFKGDFVLEFICIDSVFVTESWILSWIQCTLYTLYTVWSLLNTAQLSFGHFPLH